MQTLRSMTAIRLLDVNSLALLVIQQITAHAHGADVLLSTSIADLGMKYKACCLRRLSVDLKLTLILQTLWRGATTSYLSRSTEPRTHLPPVKKKSLPGMVSDGQPQITFLDGGRLHRRPWTSCTQFY